MESHERVIAELTEDYEAKLAEEALRIEQLQGDKTELEREFEEIKHQLEVCKGREGRGRGGGMTDWTKRREGRRVEEVG